MASSLLFNKQKFTTDSDESVLDLLLRNKQDISYSCKSGSCQSCLLQSDSELIDADAQIGLKATAIAKGYFLSCQQKAASIAQADFIDNEALFSKARLVSKHLYCQDVCRLILEPANPLFFHAGQFINLKSPQGIIRSYSLASLPSGYYLELHIGLMPGGQMTQWLFDDFNVDDYVDIQGPTGDCFYTVDDKSKPLVLIGTGTGAAPLIGIAKDAIRSNHQGGIHFYNGSKARSTLYLFDELSKLQHQQNNFYYYPSVTGEPEQGLIKKGRCNDLLMADIEQYKDAVFYLCGNPDMVNQTKRKLYLSGISLANIHADPFDYKDLRKAPRC